MVVMTIISIMLIVGVPALAEFVADKRVRTVTSDLTSDIAMARARAVESSRRVYIEKLGVTWNNGWRIYADINDDVTYTPGVDLELKRFDGFATGTIYICNQPASNQIIFRPDGRVVRNAPSPIDGIYVVDTMSASTPITSYKIRGVQYGISGRATVVKMNGQALPCAAN